MSLSGSDDEMEMDFLRDRYQEMDGGNFEVFLSFRGEDTRASFTSHLYTALQNAGIFVFKDDESLSRGKQISPSLRLAIEESRISIVVFSKNYAESIWCMKELEKIMECHRTIGNVVIPVFYDVDPSEVRHQRGDFGKAFRRLLSKFSIEKEVKVLDWKQLWWKTLREICDISALQIIFSSWTERRDKLDNRWKKTLLVQISKILDLNPRWKMKIADSIESIVSQSTRGLLEGDEIPFRKEKVDDVKDFLVKQWTEVFFEPVSISEVALLDPCGETKIANAIKLNLEHCREALFEAAGISRNLVLNFCEETEITNAIELHMKHWMDAFSKDDGTVLHSGYPCVHIQGLGNSITFMESDFQSRLETVYSEISSLKLHWREKVLKAYGNELYSR
ncbi:hypothetical protein LR48_Vigan661s001600 [Vigna angularis]|nr:hypothetical protein LR48_Vigan661s001600 [Vigna angularis]